MDELTEHRFQLHDDRFDFVDQRLDRVEARMNNRASQRMNRVMVTLFVLELVIGVFEVWWMVKQHGF